MTYMNIRVRIVAVTVTAGLALSGCSDATPTPAAPAAPEATTAEATIAATAKPSPSASPSPVLADGRSAVYLTGLGAKTISFDLIDFLTGDAAKAQWKKEHPDNPDGPDNDYMIVNNNTKLRTLPVATDAKIVVLASLGSTDTKTIDFAALPAALKEQQKGITLTAPQIAVLPFWLTVKEGSVVKVEEQFVP